MPSPSRSTARVLRWRWRLANGGDVTAEIDVGASTETVMQGERVLSQCARGAKPDGHVVTVNPERPPGSSERPGIEAVVTFAPATAVCILRVDGEEVTPLEWPVRAPPPAPPPPRPYGTYVLAAVAIVASVAFGLWVRTTRSDAQKASDHALGGTYRAPNGLFVAHYPEGYETKPAVLPPGAGGVVLEDETKSTTILLGAITSEVSGTTDPWVLQQRLRDEALVNLPKGIGQWEEGARREETCLGKPGAVVTGRIVAGSRARSRIWSCTFATADAGYIALYMLAEPARSADERRARGIVDATELTRLADLGPLPAGQLPPGLNDPIETGGVLPAGSLPRLDLPIPR